MFEQPPLPVQEFLPPQPLSPVLQPPLPLQVFLPAQQCLSSAAAGAVAAASFVASAAPSAGGVLPPHPTRPATMPPTAEIASVLPKSIVLSPCSSRKHPDPSTSAPDRASSL